jgi:flagellar biosynthesis chaperone FliJ
MKINMDSYQMVMFTGLVALAVVGIISRSISDAKQNDPLRDTDGDGITDAQELLNLKNDYMRDILTEATEGLTLKHFAFSRTENGGTNVNVSIEDETAKEDWTHAKKELRLVKRNVAAARKDIHEQLQEMRREYRNDRANMAPTLRGGGKYGQWIRAAQHLNRYAQRRGHVNSLGTYEVARELCDEVLETMDKLRNIVDSKLLELV